VKNVAPIEPTSIFEERSHECEPLLRFKTQRDMDEFRIAEIN
jgi:hypothetical protein